MTQGVPEGSRPRLGVEFFDLHYGSDTVWLPDLPHHILRTAKSSGTFYELDVLTHLRDWVRRGGTWIDVGANVGNHTVYFSRYTADRVVSLEPHPDTYALLIATIARNALTNVIPLNVAASDHQGIGRLAAAGDPGCNALDVAGHTTVSVDRLDSIVDGPVRVIKVDVEGHGPAVLRGASDILRRHRPHVMAEAADPQRLHAMEEALHPLGYRTLA